MEKGHSLPAELFRDIIQYTVQSQTFKHIVALRLVSKLFDSEVLVACEALELIKFTCYSMWQTPNRQKEHSAVLFLARFLLRRPQAPPTAPWYTNASTFLNYILDRLGYTASADRLQALVVLIETANFYVMLSARWHRGPFNAVSATLHPRTRITGRVEPAPSINKQRRCHILCAAILLRRSDHYAPVVDAAVDGDSMARAALKRDSGNFGTPLLAAVWSGQLDLVHRLLSDSQLTKTVEVECLQAAAEKGDMKMAQLLLQFKATASSCEVQLAIVRCAEVGNIAMARLLFEHIEALKDPTNVKYPLYEGVFQAGLHNQEDMVQFLVGRGAGVLNIQSKSPPHPSVYWSTTRPRYGPIDMAAWAGKEERLKFLLARCDGKVTTKEMWGAVETNQTGTLRMLISYCSQPGRETISWADLAGLAGAGVRKGKIESLRSIIEEEPEPMPGRQASIRENHEWDGVMRVACHCGSLEAFDILVRAGLPFDKPASDDRFGSYACDATGWTPIMFAQISAWPESRLIVRRLRELGVQEVDMLTTSARELFKNGKLPEKAGIWRCLWPYIQRGIPYGRLGVDAWSSR